MTALRRMQAFLISVALTGAAVAQTVPAGTPLLVRTIDGVDSSRHAAGHRFSATLESDLMAGGVPVARRGTLVYGRLAQAQASGRLVGQSQMTVELTGVVISGQIVPILTSDVQVKGSRTGAQTARRVGVGAAIGGIANGSKGARRGAAVGAGVAVLAGGQQVNVPAGTLLEFRLRQPVQIGAAQPAAAQPVQQPPAAQPAVQRPPVQQPAPAGQPMRGATVPAGTWLLVRTADSLDSRQHPTGYRFTTYLEADLVTGGFVVAPRGSTVYGRLAQAKQSGRLVGRSELTVELDGILIGGQIMPMRSSAVRMQSGSTTRDTARRVGVGVGIGSVLNGKKGRRRGAAVGLGTSVLLGGQQVNIPAGTLLEFQLMQPFTVQ